MGATKHVEHFRAKHMKPGEQVIAWAEGYIGELMGSGKNTQHNGALIITETRVAFCRKGLLGEVFESIPLKNVTSVERKTLLGHHTLRFHTSHDDLSFKCFQKDQADAAAEAVEVGRTRGEAERLPGAAAGESPLDALKKLGELKTAGVISDEEFEAKKAELLNRL